MSHAEREKAESIAAASLVVFVGGLFTRKPMVAIAGLAGLAFGGTKWTHNS